MKKLPAILLVLALACPLAACGDEPITPPAATTTAPAVTTEAPETAIPQKNGDLTLLDGEKSLFTVIRGMEAGESEIDAAQDFVARAEALTGKRLTFVTDELGKNETVDPTALEILIGSTNRPESAELAGALPAMTFGIRTTDTKIVIAAADAINLDRAIEYFFTASEAVSYDEATGRLRVTKSIDYISEPYNYLAELLPTADTFSSTAKLLYTIKAPDDKSKIVQGGTVHDGYIYQAFIYKDTASDEANNIVRILKVDLATGEVIKTSGNLDLNHANDITYNTKLNRLVVVHNNPNRTRVTLIDPETLEVSEIASVPNQIYSMDYDPARDQYIVGLSGGQSFMAIGGDLNRIPGKLRGAKPTARTNGYTTQGAATEGDYIYFVLYNQNVITVYDWDYNFVTLIELDIGKLEPENITVIGNDIYVISTTAGGGAASVWLITPEVKK